MYCFDKMNIYDSWWDGRIAAYDCKVIAELEDGTVKLLDKVNLETDAKIYRYTEPAPCEWLHDDVCYHYEFDDIDFARVDDYYIKKVIEVIKADWEVIDFYWKGSERRYED